MNVDWTEEQVKSYITYSLNTWNYDDPPEEHKLTHVNAWKCWLWLEKNGYTFNDYSIHYSMNQWRGNTFPEYYEFVVGVTDWQERRMVFHVRNVMRAILGLPLLTETQFDLIISKPVAAVSRYYYLWKDDIRYQYDPDRYNIEDMKADDDDIISTLRRKVPLNWQLAIKAAEKSGKGGREMFYDAYTGIGAYEFYHDVGSFLCIYGILINDAFDVELDRRYPECHTDVALEYMKWFRKRFFKQHSGKSFKDLGWDY